LLPILSSKGFHHQKEIIFSPGVISNYHSSEKFHKGASLSNTVIQNTSNILFLSLTRYLDGIIDYACFCEEDHKLYQIMNAFEISDPRTLYDNSYIPAAFIGGIERRFSKYELDLVRSIDVYFSLLHANDSAVKNRRKAAINRFRHFAIRSFLLPKLKHELVHIDRKVNMLLILLHMLDIERIKKNYEFSQDIYLTMSTHDDEYLTLDVDVVEIIACIFTVLHTSIIGRSINSTVISYSYASLRCLLAKTINGHTCSLMQWSINNQDEDENAKRINAHMEALYLLSHILTSYKLQFIVERYNTFNFQSDENSNVVERYKILISSAEYFRELRHSTHGQTPQNHYTGQSKVSELNNSGFDHNISKETIDTLMFFQNEYSKSTNIEISESQE
jgi:hypothetical protein